MQRYAAQNRLNDFIYDQNMRRKAKAAAWFAPLHVIRAYDVCLLRLKILEQGAPANPPVQGL